MEVNKLLKIDRGSKPQSLGMILKGVTSVVVLGSQSKPSALAGMVDLTESGAITADGAYAFVVLPEWIYLNGTITSAEEVNFSVAKTFGVLA